MSTQVSTTAKKRSQSVDDTRQSLVSSVFAKVAGTPLDGLQQHFTPAALGNSVGEERLELLRRLDKCSPQWLSETCAHLRSACAIDGRRLLDTLGKHEDWSALSVANMRNARALYRECGVDEALFGKLDFYELGF